VDLENGDDVELRREAGMHNHITLAAGFVEMLEQTLSVKLAEFREQAEQGAAGEAGCGVVDAL
jgi:hypothetical protein